MNVVFTPNLIEHLNINRSGFSATEDSLVSMMANQNEQIGQIQRIEINKHQGSTLPVIPIRPANPFYPG
jgi:hypothetical protein